VAGYEWNQSILVGNYWKNGMALTLIDKISMTPTGISSRAVTRYTPQEILSFYFAR